MANHCHESSQPRRIVPGPADFNHTQFMRLSRASGTNLHPSDWLPTAYT